MAKTLGLAIGERYISISQVERKGNQLVPLTLAFEQIPINPYVNDSQDAEKQVITAIKKILADAGVKSKETAIVIPDSHGYTRILEMPKLTEKELISALRYQADQFVPIPIEQVSLDIEILHEDEKNKKLLILLVASANAMIDKITRIVEGVGLLPLAMENEASASLRFITQTMQAKAQAPTTETTGPTPLTIFMNFGHSSTSLHLFDMVRRIPIQTVNFAVGLDIFARELRTNLSLADKEVDRILFDIGFSDVSSAYKVTEIVAASYNELVSEAQRFIVFAKERYNSPIDKIHLFGEGCLLKALDTKFSSSLGIKIELLNPYAYMVQNNVAQFFKNNLPLFVHSIGASLRE